MKIDVCPVDDPQTFKQIERVGRAKHKQTNLTERDVELVINLTHEKVRKGLVRRTKSSTFGLGLRALFKSQNWPVRPVISKMKQ